MAITRGRHDNGAYAADSGSKRRAHPAKPTASRRRRVSARDETVAKTAAAMDAKQLEAEPSAAAADAADDATNDDEDERICSICFDPIEDGPVADPERRKHTLECGHMFHVGCARAALSHAPRCPYCRDERRQCLTPARSRATGGGPAGETPDWSNPDAREIRGVCARCGDPVFRGQDRVRAVSYTHLTLPTILLV